MEREGAGDCETDIEALEAVIAENDTMGDLTFGEVQQVGALMTSITTACSPERAEEFLAQPEVEEFLGIGRLSAGQVASPASHETGRTGQWPV